MIDPYKTLLAVLLPASLGVAACGGEEATGCMSVADDAETCAPASDVNENGLEAGCGATVRAITGEGTLSEDYGYGYDTAAEPGLQCCYPVVRSQPTCTYGRPFMAAGAPRVAGLASDAHWREAPVPDLDDVPRAALIALADAWAEAALDEHAAVAAFGKVALELMAFGAPPELVAAHHRAALEEITHARLGFGLASAYAGRAVGPGAFPLGASVALAPSLEVLAVAAAQEGCLGETLTTLVVAETLAQMGDPAVRAVLERILAEERDHAALAWRTVRWAIDAGGPEVRAAVAEVFARAARDGLPLPTRLADGPHRDVLVAHGVPDRAICERALHRGLQEVVLPAARALVSDASLAA